MNPTLNLQMHSNVPLDSLFETNFHGVVRVTNAVLPIMRAQRNGRILNVGSGLGFIPAPYNAGGHEFELLNKPVHPTDLLAKLRA
jgi:NADP-dependent 3-hydroxy acid dehydrogenase YdfG